MIQPEAPQRPIVAIIAVIVVVSLSAVCPWNAGASVGLAAEVCIAIDQSRDMLAPRDREAAIMFVSRQFEREGQQVVPAACATPYTLTHIRLGNTFVVTLSGSGGTKEGTALGMNDLPALYNQMVRSLVTGRPMVIERGNVTVSQSAPVRVRAESFRYMRIGYGGVREQGGAALGFGRRFELDNMGIDVSYLNFQTSSGGPSLVTLVKLEALHFISPVANSTAYVGAGLSYGGISGGRQDFSPTTSGRWDGNGLQGELSAGYEFARTSSLRLFVQADVTLPFYKARFQQVSYMFGPGFTERRHMPAAAISLGVGWGSASR